VKGHKDSNEADDSIGRPTRAGRSGL